MNLKALTRDLACDRIELFAREERLVQGMWHGGRNGNDGRELACLLGSIDPGIDKPDKCPATVMPQWLAQLLPTLFDGVRKEKTVDYGLRFAKALRTGNTDESVMRRFLIACVESAVRSASPKGELPPYWAAVEKACADVVTLLKAGELDADEAERAWTAAKEAGEAARAWTAEAVWFAAKTAEEAARAWFAAKTAKTAKTAKEAERVWFAAKTAKTAEEAERAWFAAKTVWFAAKTAARAAAPKQYELLFDALLEAMTT